MRAVSRRSFGSVRALPSGRFQASYHDPSTAERVRAPWTFGSISDARASLSTVAADSVRGELLDPRLSRRPFAEWAQEWLGGLHLKPKTLVGYESTLRVHVLPVFADRPVVAITYRDCKRFVDELLHAGLAPGTVGQARKVLRLVLQEAVRADAIRRNPAEGRRVPRGRRDEMVYLDADEVLSLADAVARPPRPERHAAKEWPAYSLLVRLGAFTGVRAGEVAALRVVRVNPLHGRLHVEESVAEVHGRARVRATQDVRVAGCPDPGLVWPSTSALTSRLDRRARA